MKMTPSEIREFVRENKVKIVNKQNSRLMRFIAWFLSVTCINKKFMNSYTTTIGRTIYIPNYMNTDDFLTEHAITLEHEFVHVKQYAKWKHLYSLSYLLLPIPFGLAWFRWRWEREAYLVNIRHGYPIEWVVRGLWSYGWPWPKKWMKKWFEENK